MTRNPSQDAPGFQAQVQAFYCSSCGLLDSTPISSLCLHLHYCMVPWFSKDPYPENLKNSNKSTKKTTNSPIEKRIRNWTRHLMLAVWGARKNYQVEGLLLTFSIPLGRSRLQGKPQVGSWIHGTHRKLPWGWSWIHWSAWRLSSPGDKDTSPHPSPCGGRYTNKLNMEPAGKREPSGGSSKGGFGVERQYIENWPRGKEWSWIGSSLHYSWTLLYVWNYS